jgi:hypothetical protein
MPERIMLTIIGPIPILLSALSAYSYFLGLISRRTNNSVVVFTTLLLSALVITSSLYPFNEPSFLWLSFSQSLTAMFAYALLKIAIERGENEPALLAKSRFTPATLARLALVSSASVIGLNAAAPVLAPAPDVRGSRASLVHSTADFNLTIC